MKYKLSLNILPQKYHIFNGFSCWMLKFDDIPHIYFRNVFWNFTMFLFKSLALFYWHTRNVYNDLQGHFRKRNRKITNLLPFLHPNCLIIKLFITNTLVFKNCCENIFDWIVTWNLSCIFLLVIKLTFFEG